MFCGTEEWNNIGINGKKIQSISIDPTNSSTIHAATSFKSGNISIFSEDSSVGFEENWNSGEINAANWNFVDNVNSSHGGHKASVVDGELFINAYNDWTQDCGIISKTGFSYNTKLTLKFRIHQVVVYNQYQGILSFKDSGVLNENGYTTGNQLFSLCGGNNNTRTLFIRDAEGNEYSLGNYTADQNYNLEIVFTDSETRVTTNGKTITIPKSYQKYHVHFGGHIQDSYFDNLKIESLDGLSNDLPFFDDFEAGNLNNWEISRPQVTASSDEKKNGTYSMKLYDNSSTSSPGVKLTNNTNSSRIGLEFYEWTNDFGWNGGSTYSLETTTAADSGWAFLFGAQTYTGGNWRYINTQNKSEWAGKVNPWINLDRDFPTITNHNPNSWHKIKLELYGPEGKARFWYDEDYKGEIEISATSDPIKYFEHGISWSRRSFFT